GGVAGEAVVAQPCEQAPSENPSAAARQPSPDLQSSWLRQGVPSSPVVVNPASTVTHLLPMHCWPIGQSDAALHRPSSPFEHAANRAAAAHSHRMATGYRESAARARQSPTGE